MDVFLTFQGRCLMQTERLMGCVNHERRNIDQAFIRPLRMMIDKCMFKGITRLVAKGLVLIVGVWLLTAAFIMRDIQVSLYFMSTLLIIYVMVVILIHHKVFRAKERDWDKPWQRRNAVLWVRTEQSEQGIRLTIFKRPYGIAV